jgi:orotate phosphoribosyltransferase
LQHITHVELYNREVIVLKNINDLIQKAVELQSKGLLVGQIADELNVSRETATWLLAHAKKGDVTPPKDIYVNWKNIGKSSFRMRYLSRMLADLLMDCLEENNAEVDTVIGIALSGVPLATMIAEELGVNFAAYHPTRHLFEPESGAKDLRGTLSQNFAKIEGCTCIIIDDVITTGRTIKETITTLEESGATVNAIGVVVDKRGNDYLSGVPVNALITLTRVDKVE